MANVAVMDVDILLRSIRRRAMVPDNQRAFTEQDLIDMINEEVFTGFLPHIMSTHEEYLVFHEDVALVSGQTNYKIPTRAVGNKLREVSLVSQSGAVYELSRVSLEDLSEFHGSFSGNSRNVFYLENNEVVLPNNVVDQSGFLRLYYYLRPNTMVKSNRAGVITAIDTVTGVITLSSFPDHFGTGITYDFVASNPPNNLTGLSKVSTDSVIGDKTVTFAAADLPSDLAVGDYLMCEHETIVPQIPLELQTVLAQRVALTIAESLGDTEGAGNIRNKLEKMEKDVLNMIENRVEGAPQKFSNRNTVLRSATGNGRFRS